MGHNNMDEDVILLFSPSFPDGAILTKDAFILFLKSADTKEKESFQYSIISAYEAAHTEYPFYDTTALSAELLGSFQAH